MERKENKQKRFVHEAGVTYFSKRTERRVLFLLTLVMLTWGIVDYVLNNF